jgi:integrase
MRGSVYYQTATLVKYVFAEGAKKKDRIDPSHHHFQCVASYQTMEAYRRIWNNFALYLKEVWALKDLEQLTSNYVQDYCDYKITGGISKQYAEKINSALGKLEVALQRFNNVNGQVKQIFDFSIRQIILDEARRGGILVSNYHNRAYSDPIAIINAMNNDTHRLAATIQWESGTRYKGIHIIKPDQLKGIAVDEVTGKRIGVIHNKEKGGNEGDIQVSEEMYQALEAIIYKDGILRIDYQRYICSINMACDCVGQPRFGSHGFRWSFVKRRMREYQRHGRSYDQAMQCVSWECKHGRKSITDHYLGNNQC